MEYLIYIILGLAGFGYYQYQSKKKTKIDTKLANVKGQDKQLKDQQLDVQREISMIDEAIKKLREEFKDQSKENKTLEERTDKWNKK